MDSTKALNNLQKRTAKVFNLYPMETNNGRSINVVIIDPLKNSIYQQNKYTVLGFGSFNLILFSMHTYQLKQ